MGSRFRLKRVPEILIAAGALLAVVVLVTGLERLFPGPEIPADESPILGFPEGDSEPFVHERKDGTVIISLGNNFSRIRFDGEEQKRAFLDCMRTGMDGEAIRTLEEDSGSQKAARTRASRVERRERRRRFQRLVDSCLEQALPVPAPPVPDSDR